MSRTPKAVLCVLVLLAVAVPAWATETGGTLPWNEPLETIMDNITGPTATAIILIAVAAFLMTWALMPDNRALLNVAKAVAALSVIALLTSFLSNIGIASACI